MTQRRSGRGRAVRLACGLALAATATVAPSTAAPPSVAAASDELVVVAQQFNVAVDGTFDVTLQVADGLIELLDDPDAVVVVTSHRPVRDRTTFLAALGGALPRSEDTFDVLLAAPPVITDGGTVNPAVASRPTADTVSLRIPTESAGRTSAALQFSEPGVHPVVLELRAGRRRFETTTFVNRLPGADDTETGAATGSLSVGLILGQTAVPGVDDAGRPRISTDETADLTSLADSLSALDAAGAEDAPLPRAVVVEPASLSALDESDPDLAARLWPLLAASNLVAGPRLPLDPSAVAGSTSTSATDPVDLYTRWLRGGEDLLDALLPTTAIDRSVHVATTPLTRGGATMLRNLGTRLIVLPFDRFSEMDGSTGFFTDTSQLMTVELADGTSMPAVVVDPYLGERIDAATVHPVASAVEIVADLLVIAESIREEGRLVGRHGLVLASSNVGVPDAALVAALVPMLQSTPGLELVDPGELGSIVDSWLIDGRPVTLVPSDEATTTLDQRLALVDRLGADIAAYGSMLSANDPAVADWRRVTDAIPSTAITDAQAATMASSLDSQFAQLAAGIEVEASSFTLTGRTSVVRLGVRNTTDRTVTVKVRLNSPKIRFPEGDQLVVIPPQAVADVVADAIALSNGTSSVFVRVYTPQGPTDETLVPQVVLTARVTSFAGVAQLITVAALLLIVAWWARHWRRSHRTRQAAVHRDHHPATTQRRAEQPSDELSPDAAASTLPPP